MKIKPAKQEIQENALQESIVKEVSHYPVEIDFLSNKQNVIVYLPDTYSKVTRSYTEGIKHWILIENHRPNKELKEAYLFYFTQSQLNNRNIIFLVKN